MGRLGRLGHDPPLWIRVAATIVLLYAQPLSRVVRLSWIDNRDYVNTATNPHSCWPFLAASRGSRDS